MYACGSTYLKVSLSFLFLPFDLYIRNAELNCFFSLLSFLHRFPILNILCLPRGFGHPTALQAVGLSAARVSWYSTFAFNVESRAGVVSKTLRHLHTFF